MLTGADCREYAEQCIAEARQKTPHRATLIKIAQAWLRLADQLDELLGNDRSRISQ